MIDVDARELASYFGVAGCPRRSFYTRDGWHTWVVARRDRDYVQVLTEDRSGNVRAETLPITAARKLRDALDHALAADEGSGDVRGDE